MVDKTVFSVQNITRMAKKSLLGNEKLTPLLIIVSIILAFAVGVLWQKVENLGGGLKTTPSQGQAVVDPQQPQARPQGPSLGKVPEEQASKLPRVTRDDHVRGNPGANIALIEYSDYECPFCARFHPTAQQVVDEYGDQVKWVYRHFPLDAIHPRARTAAMAAECVAELGGNDAFWRFTDLLYEDITKIGDLSPIAQSAGVNVSQFESCVQSGRYADKVEKDYQEGLAAGVSGTPGNFILNETTGDVWFVPGAYPFDQLKTYIDEALQS